MTSIGNKNEEYPTIPNSKKPRKTRFVIAMQRGMEGSALTGTFVLEKLGSLMLKYIGPNPPATPSQHLSKE